MTAPAGRATPWATTPAQLARSYDDALRNCPTPTTVIGLAASGTTPFVVADVAAAVRAGAWTCGIANNPGTPLTTCASLGIVLATGPEILCGSTRLQAGTAQKLTLTRITTAAMIRCGRIIENHMVDLVVTIDKLRARAVHIVCDLADVDASAAHALLEDRGWSVRAALQAATEGGRRLSRCTSRHTPTTSCLGAAPRF